MIQPKWNNLSESTQRAVNAPSQSQLQEAYKAGYYRALTEQVQGQPVGGGAGGAGKMPRWPSESGYYGDASWEMEHFASIHFPNMDWPPTTMKEWQEFMYAYYGANPGV